MPLETAVSTANAVAEKNDPNFVIQFLLVCTVLVLLTMVYKAWNVMLASRSPSRTPPTTPDVKARRKGPGRRHN